VNVSGESDRARGRLAPGPAVRWWLAGGVLLAVGVVVVLTVLAGVQPYTAVGNADPGPLVALGTPLLRLAADLAGAVCVGSLAFVVCCTPAEPSGSVTAEGYAELLVARRAAAVWCASTAMLVAFGAADTAGEPLSGVLVPAHLAGLVDAMEPPKAWLFSALITFVVAIGCRVVLGRQSVAVLLVLAVLGLLPAAVTGHGSADVGHDLALAAVMVHVPAAALWIGLLLALVRHARRGRTALSLLARRYVRIAGACWLVLAGSGVVLGLVLVPPGRVAASGYVALLAVKVVAVGALGLLGVTLRRRALRRLTATPAAAAGLVRLVLAELVVLLGVLGASVELTRLPVPDVLGRAVTTADTVLGYDLAGPPTPGRLLGDWRVDVLFGPLSMLMAAGYLVAVRRVRAHGQPWPAGRVAGWLGGCLVLLLATSSGLGRYAAAMFSAHMASHMLVSMLAPALLVLGAPLTLVRAALPPGAPGELPGPREWVEQLRAAGLVRALTHPAVALGLFAGSPFALYFTGLFDAAVRFHWAHLAIDAWFLAVGYLFLWPVIGVDPAPRPLPNLARLGMLLAAMPADILFGAALIGTRRVIGNGAAAANMYQALALPWVPDLSADQRLAGVFALAIGELALFVVLAALLTRWNRVDDSGDDAGLGTYRTALREVRTR
jgi:cytochrome c oxidase assembly factor CtaG/putative copper export protein